MYSSNRLFRLMALYYVWIDIGKRYISATISAIYLLLYFYYFCLLLSYEIDAPVSLTDKSHRRLACSGSTAYSLTPTEGTPSTAGSAISQSSQ